MEIRAIRSDEADAFLRLLCRSFDLDLARARSVFYSEPLFDLKSKWALFDGRLIRSILTTTQLDFGWGSAIGIAGVTTDSSYRGLGLGESLVRHVLDEAASRGIHAAMLFAQQTTLYSRAGFEVVDHVVRGTLRVEHSPRPLPRIRPTQVRKLYDAWSAASPHRLRRDDRRWSYWTWMNRTCEALPHGYLCFEPSLCREVVAPAPVGGLPVLPGTEWLGLRSMTRSLGLDLSDEREELYLMARGIPHLPELFMTDQF